MENNIIQHRLAVQQNISKAFENDFDADIEKGKWKVGMTLTNSKGTFKVTGFSASTGRPTWSKVKDGDKGDKQQQQQGSSFKNTVKMSEKDFDDSVNKKFEIVNQDGLKLVYDNNKHVATYSKKNGVVWFNDNSWKKQQASTQQGSTTVQKNTDQNYKQYEFVGTKQPKDWDGWKKLVGDDVVFDGYRNMYVKGDDGKLKQIGMVVTDDKFYFNKVDGNGKTKNDESEDIQYTNLKKIEDVEKYAKSLNGIKFNNVKSGWGDKNSKAFELTYGKGGKLLIDFLHNGEFVYKLTDANGKKVDGTSSTMETDRINWSEMLNPDYLLKKRIGNMDKTLQSLKRDAQKKRKKYLDNYSTFSEKFEYQRASEKVGDYEKKIADVKSSLNNF